MAVDGASGPMASTPKATLVDARLLRDVRLVSMVRAARLPVAVVIGIAIVHYSSTSLSQYHLTLTTQAGTYATAVLGLTVILGYAGQVTLGHIAFMGLGAYLTAVSTAQWGLAPALGMVISVVGACIAAVIVGWPTLRLRGAYLAVVTYSLGQAFVAFISRSTIFNGQLGIGPIPRFSAFGWTAQSWSQRHVLVWTIAIVGAVGAAQLARFRFGRALAVVAHDEALAESVGIRTRPLKVAAFVFSAALAGLAGSLFAFTNGYVAPQSFGFQTTIVMFAVLFAAGVRSVIGALVASVVLVVVPEIIFEDFQELRPTLFSVVVLLALLIRTDSNGSSILSLARRARVGRGRT